MGVIQTETNETLQWYNLVIEAEGNSECNLPETSESYLVFLLHRFAQKPEIAGSVLALAFLDSMNAIGKSRVNALRDVGDQCLLFAGFFPEQASKKLVNVGYFIDLGRTAYDEISNLHHSESAEVFEELTEQYLSMLQILHAIRNMNDRNRIPPLLAMEIWQETNSQEMLRCIDSGKDSILVNNYDFLKVKH
ncbi:MAG: hypothetical protein D6B27_11010 [Gammaproteobacteria bacterium]|nr:MAG: hypothetical protein D6B27_11010 [Gammaproteobacteria bacterium]